MLVSKLIPFFSSCSSSLLSSPLLPSPHTTSLPLAPVSPFSSFPLFFFPPSWPLCSLLLPPLSLPPFLASLFPPPSPSFSSPLLGLSVPSSSPLFLFPPSWPLCSLLLPPLSLPPFLASLFPPPSPSFSSPLLGLSVPSSFPLFLFPPSWPLCSLLLPPLSLPPFLASLFPPPPYAEEGWKWHSCSVREDFILGSKGWFLWEWGPLFPLRVKSGKFRRVKSPCYPPAPYIYYRAFQVPSKLQKRSPDQTDQ